MTGRKTYTKIVLVMKIITKNSDYAVRTLCSLVKAENFVSTRTISKETNVPLPYLRRIIDTLTKEKILETKEGKNGGVKLKKDPSSIKLSDIIRLFQGEIQVSRCVFRKALCPNRKNCLLRKKLLDIEKILIKQFENITIKSLVEKKEAK